MMANECHDKTRRVTVIQANTVDQHQPALGWKSCLKPFWKWIKFIGMSIDSDESDSCFFIIRRWVLYLSVLCLHFTVIVHLFCNTENIASIAYTKDGHISNTLQWNFLIDVLSYATYVIGVYTSHLLSITRSSGLWKSLIDSLDLLEIRFPLSTHNHTRVRKWSIVATIYVIVSVL